MATKKLTPAQSTWTPQALANLANAFLALPGNAPTPEMLANPAITYSAPTTTVVTPAVAEAPPTVPFLSPDQMQAVNQLFFDTGNQLAALTKADVDALTQTMAQIGDPTKFNPNDDGTDLTGAVNKGAMINKTSATDQAIARGLFQSSIRDADLADIEATRQMRRNFFRDQYDSVTKANDTQRKSITDYLKTSVGAGYDPNDPTTLGGNFGSMAVENALNNPGAPGTPAVTKTDPARFSANAPAQAATKLTTPKPVTDPDPTRHAASMEYVFGVGRGAMKKRGKKRG